MWANPRPATNATVALAFDGGAIDYEDMQRLRNDAMLSVG